MKIAYIIFNQITLLDFIGVYDPISRLKAMNFIPDLQWDICSFTETVEDNYGLQIVPGKIALTLSGYDAIIVPGGSGTHQLQADDDFIGWIKSAEPSRYKISICSGSLILGAAGFLKEKKATTHFQEYDLLKTYGANVVDERIVEDGDTITAGAVSSSLDLGLFICEKWAGIKARVEISRKMDYHGYPINYGAGL